MMQTSLAIQWLGLSTFTARAQVQSLVGELISGKTPRMTKKKERELRKLWWPPRCSCVLHTSKMSASPYIEDFYTIPETRNRNDQEHH